MNAVAVERPNVKPIVLYGNAVLSTPAEAVTVFDDSLRELVVEMFTTMRHAGGVGLSAPQIGIGKRVAVIDLQKEEESTRLVLINPEIISKGGLQTGLEGCLSVPGFRGHITRSAYVRVRANTMNEGWFEFSAEGLLARAIQHEVDHLNGLLYVRMLSSRLRARIEHTFGGHK